MPPALRLWRLASALFGTSLRTVSRHSPLPQHSPRRLVNPAQTLSIRVTENVSACSGIFASPQSDFAAWSSYIYNASGPPRNRYQSCYLSNMVRPSTPVSCGSTAQLPQINLEHERTHSNASSANVPTPVSMADNSLPSPVTEQQNTTMSSPCTHTRQLSEDISSDRRDGPPQKNHSYKRAEEPPRNSESKMICKQLECSGITFDRKCEWR